MVQGAIKLRPDQKCGKNWRNVSCERNRVYNERTGKIGHCLAVLMMNMAGMKQVSSCSQ